VVWFRATASRALDGGARSRVSRAVDTRFAAHRLHMPETMLNNFDDITTDLDTVHGGFKMPGWAQRAIDKGKDLVETGKKVAEDVWRNYRHMPTHPTLPIK
jgi:hypothetical protein